MNTNSAMPIEQYEEINAKPVLKWAGGKGMLLPQLREHLPNKLKVGSIKCYIEPFVGGGAMFFDLIRNYTFENVYLFDTNPELIILYNVIKNDVEGLIKEVSAISEKYFSIAPEERDAFYYTYREIYNNHSKNMNANHYSNAYIVRAAITIFLNRTCFNGLYRVNSKGYFNVPVGKYKKPRIADEDNLREVSKALQGATIKQSDFSSALEYANEDSFIYYDPPYRPIDKTSFNSYTISDFNDDEQKRLKHVFDKANTLGALQMLSNSDPTNYNSEDIFFDDLYRDYNIHRIWAKRMINANPNGRNGVRELLITNY
jgi:DNA adenine methylase